MIWRGQLPRRWGRGATYEVGGRLAEGDEIVAEIPAPEGLNLLARALDGEDGRTMLIRAAPDLHEQAREAAREAVLLTARVDGPHAGRL